MSIPSRSIYAGEVVTFTWSDLNTYDGYLTAPGVHPMIPNDNNHHTVSLLPSKEEYMNCDFRREKLLAVKPDFKWTTAEEGTYYFASRYGDDCSKNNIKTLIRVIIR